MQQARHTQVSISTEIQKTSFTAFISHFMVGFVLVVFYVSSPQLLQLFRRMLHFCFAGKLQECFVDYKTSHNFPSSFLIVGWTYPLSLSFNLASSRTNHSWLQEVILRDCVQKPTLRSFLTMRFLYNSSAVVGQLDFLYSQEKSLGFTPGENTVQLLKNTQTLWNMLCLHDVSWVGGHLSSGTSQSLQCICCSCLPVALLIKGMLSKMLPGQSSLETPERTYFKYLIFVCQRKQI